MGKSAVRVVLRTRPTDSFAQDCVRLQDDGKTMVVLLPKRGMDIVNHSQENFTFKLDRIMHNATQEQVFEGCGVDMVTNALDGYNGTILSYGQTGGGKTYTMIGGGDYKTRGIVPRVVKHLFDEVTTRVDKMFEVSISFLEIYNERIHDLLDTTNAEEMLIQEDVKGNISVKGLTKRACSSESEALQHLFEGAQNRSVGAHSLNPVSSRSHVVYTLHISSRTRIESGSAALTSKIHCIDLAGSERLGKSGSEGQLMKEAQYINKSLSFLEHCVLSLGNINHTHVPFRQSKLTNLLKDSLGGNCQTTMIANVWPEERHMEETLGTLKFATRMMKVQNEASVNVMLDSATQIKQLQKLVAELKAELQMQNQLHAKSHVTYEGELGEDERFEMEKIVKQYFTTQVAEIPINSIREVKEYFKIMKGYVTNLEAEAGTRGAGGATVHAGAPAAPTKGAHADHRKSLGGTMGEPEGAGHGVGVAAAARNIRDIVASTHQGPPGPLHASPPKSVRGGDAHGSARGDDDTGASAVARAAYPDRARAYEDFKLADGSELNRLMKESQSQLAERRGRIQDMSQMVNAAKAKIDSSKSRLDAAQMQRMAVQGGKDLVDDSEQAVLRELHAYKAEYKSCYDEMSTLKTEKEFHAKMVEQTRAKLLQEFDSWFSRYNEGDGADGAGMLGRGANVDDQLDEGERFEMMEVAKIMDEDPDSLAFYSAKKAVPGAGGSKRKPMPKVGPTIRRNR